ncbi:DUF4479 domain-containing protein [Atopobacter sp. AH10]|uniref:YtpR family tRNA-binding protein n=1 Tax=Atopobacter sp. AH10 TaxID=2315861 RepID=UPI000EF20460|nr:DUF4479 domain-containing protein [Atopobacter sp. AH10]RLK64134.1 DUF4479 domain-containing protein [Atopobacter sp. AH10]
MKVNLFYNREAIGDVLLMAIKEGHRDDVELTTDGPLTVIRDKRSNEILGINVQEASSILDFKAEQRGHIHLEAEQKKALEDFLASKGLDEVDLTDKASLVVGHVLTCEEHPDSDHLHVTQVDVGEEELLQIVCGAPNIEAGQYVIVAKPGTVMPSGAIIYDGELRGVSSAGMICSLRELNVKNAPQVRGIHVFDGEIQPGTAVDISKL